MATYFLDGLHAQSTGYNTVQDGATLFVPGMGFYIKVSAPKTRWLHVDVTKGPVYEELQEALCQLAVGKMTGDPYNIPELREISIVVDDNQLVAVSWHGLVRPRKVEREPVPVEVYLAISDYGIF